LPKRKNIISISRQAIEEYGELAGATINTMKPAEEEVRRLATILETVQILAGTYGL
jgi:hypothetical protein